MVHGYSGSGYGRSQSGSDHTPADFGGVTVRDRVTLKVSRFIMGKRDLLGRVLVGQVTRETQKAVYFKGSCSGEAADYCHRCGKLITHPRSLRVGYGPTCSERLGIDWGVVMSDNEIEAIRAKIAETTTFEGWLPKSQVTEVLRVETEVFDTPTQPTTNVTPLSSQDRALVNLIQYVTDGSERAVAKCHRYIERHYGAWHSMTVEMRHEVLNDLAKLTPGQPARVLVGAL